MGSPSLVFFVVGLVWWWVNRASAFAIICPSLERVESPINADAAGIFGNGLFPLARRIERPWALRTASELRISAARLREMAPEGSDRPPPRSAPSRSGGRQLRRSIRLHLPLLRVYDLATAAVRGRCSITKGRRSSRATLGEPAGQDQRGRLLATRLALMASDVSDIAQDLGSSFAANANSGFG